MNRKAKSFYCWIFVITLLLGGFVTSAQVLASERPTVALVLGGGSARGFSHIGLIKALEEHGIPVDMIVGTSMGSIVAGLYAGGYSVDNMTDLITELEFGALVDIAVPLSGGIVDTTGIEHYLDILFEGKTFAEMPIPFRAVVVNLGTGKELALSEGKVSKGIQASISIPGMFAPVQIDDQFYVDGGLKNQVPANVAADLGADVIIAVSLEKDYDDPDYRRITDNLRMSITAMIEGYTEINTAMADVLIVPDVGLDSAFDYQRGAYFIEQGYKAGLKYMDQIKHVILDKDPSFQFTPYKQAGYSSEELRAIAQTAERSVANLPKKFTLKPEVQFDSDYNFPKIGAKFTHGPLNWFGIGYRYGFDSDDGGHELFVDWGREKLGSVEIYLRKSANRKLPTFGGSIQGKINRLLLEATYVSQGVKAWQVSASNTSLLETPHGVGGLSLRVTGLRPEVSDTPIEDTLLVAIAPQLQVFPWGEKQFPVGISNNRPYFLGGLTIESPVTELDIRPKFRVGVGTEMNLFGLYPSDVSLGVEIDSAATATLKFGIKGLRF
ncbi:MAG: patatin-like phospholipase family protein [Firmicutes bacterium]|nr:patatin-like phospholipase family protein [Bacillota bacterium]